MDQPRGTLEKQSNTVSDETPSQPSLSSDSIRTRDSEVASQLEVQEKMQHVIGDGENQEETDDAALEPVQSKHSVRDASSIPDGGLWAWLQVLGGFFLLFNSWGVINTYGSYSAYYGTTLLPNTSPSAISWIGSIQAFLLLEVGALTGPIYDAGYFRELLIFGSVMLVLGQMMLSLCTEYWQILLAQGFCIGIGTGALFIPSVAILSTYFSTRIGTAIGIAASGSSFGGVIYPIVFHKLLPKIGFAWTTRVLGFIVLGTMIIPNVVMRVRVLPAKSRSLLDLPAFLIPAYSFQVFGFFCGFMGLYMPFFYAQVYAIRQHITNPDLGFYLLAVMNSTSVFGRILPNLFSDKVGPFNVVIPCCLVSGLLCVCFMAVSNTAGIVVLMAFYGFFSGSFVSLPPTIIMHLSTDARDKIGTRLGQSFACIAVGVLIGTPIGGAVLDRSGFDAVWTFGGCMLFGSAAMLVMARVAFKGWGLMIRA
ncbi:MFS general substrate transporter [Cucurbitaria berberidis CBS 394.84]|uniref:MFS general substrate transporter n=1 Tax=Cucurbitaria berberidis CBS 394.84 TaxID=1168544 RepID=A0A9P4GBM8_9PLEO|nr:MFS general substrate transporter [Cucurbitaria berberidis CBS 394.84]KAF1842610.1 MFS general substrate transporter [Cucurbitaria berberidis CBS 394.84]